MDITALDVTAHAEDGVDVPIINPKTGERIGLTIKVQGAFAGRFQELLARHKKRDAMRARSAVARAMADEDEDETPAVLAEVTLGWDGMVENGVVVPFSKVEARRVYTRYPVIRGQVMAAALDVGNFIKD